MPFSSMFFNDKIDKIGIFRMIRAPASNSTIVSSTRNNPKPSQTNRPYLSAGLSNRPSTAPNSKLFTIVNDPRKFYAPRLHT